MEGRTDARKGFVHEDSRTIHVGIIERRGNYA